jgi:cytochrome c556
MRLRALAALVACTAVGIPALAPAATAPADAIKYRKAVMSAMSAHVGAFMLVNFGKVEHQDHLKAHATALADLGAQARVLFPAGTEAGDTDALPVIWKEQERFNKLVSDLQASTAKLRDAVAANDKAGTMAAFKAVGESCKGCHDRYRKADD